MRRLLIRPGAIGDFILSLPALEFARADYTEVWTAGQNVPLVRFADRAASIASTGLDLGGIEGVEPPASLWERLRSFDSIYSWYGAARQDFRRAVEGLPFRFFPALPADGAGMHAADFYLKQVGAPPGGLPRLDCPRRDGGFAVIHPFSGSARKNWPLERYRALAAWLGARMPVHWCAGPTEPLEGAWRIDDLYALACRLAGARLYIGNDSGITHLAAAAGAPAVALFGPTDPLVWAPRGVGVVVVARSPEPAIASLPLETVVSVVHSTLECGGC